MQCDRIKFVTDENIFSNVVEGLWQIGIDLRDAKEEQWHGTEDEHLIERAAQEERFILTHNFDVGTLAIKQKTPCYGLLYWQLKNLKPRHEVNV